MVAYIKNCFKTYPRHVDKIIPHENCDKHLPWDGFAPSVKAKEVAKIN